MKLKIVLTASGYCLIVGASFSLSWEHGLGAAALLATVHSMVALFRKNGHVVVIPAIPPKAASRNQQKTAKTAAKTEASELAGINKDIFKQFQSNLQDHQKNLHSPSVPQKASAAPVKPPQNPYTQSKAKFDEMLQPGQEDKVSLASKKPQPASSPKAPPARQKTLEKPSQTSAAPPKASPSKKAKPPVEHQNEALLQKLSQPLAEVGDDLFDDVQIVLPSEQSPSSSKLSLQTSQPTDLFDEGLGDSLQANDSQEEKSAEAAALLNMAQGSFQAGRVSEAKASLDNFFSVQKELKAATAWDVHYLYAKICLRLGDMTKAFASFSEMTQNGLEPTHPDYANILESIAASLEEHQLYEGALSFLYDLLNYYRQQLDRAQMDRIYDRIELALEETEDDERLIRAYKNHLEIKRILKDQYGESRLLDALGNRYYKMGDKERSRKCYEENLHLKALMNKVESP